MDVHLRWNNHQTTLLSVFSSLLDNGDLVDCTISAEGQYFKAHRVILSACSPYFELIFSQHHEKHPVVILPDVKFQILKALMEYMYSGEVKVPQNKLCTVLKLAETLQIKGLSFAGDGEMKNKLGHRRRNESTILHEQHVFGKHLCEPRHGSQVEQKGDVSSPHTLEKECSEDIDSHLPAAQESETDSSTYVSHEKPVDEPSMSEDVSDTEAFNVFECSSLTKILTKSNTCVSGILLNPVSSILDSSELPGTSRENIGEQRILSENVLPTHTTGKELRMSEPLGMFVERPVVDLLPEIKQEDPDGDSIEEIILDDDISESDDHSHDGGDDNHSTVRELLREIPEDSFSDQGFCSLEQHRDTCFVEPASILPIRFRCDVCGRSYRYHRGLSRHLKYECGKEPQFRCPHCPARYTQKHHLRTHMVRNHLSY
ncbi:longitudinals lacking protein, isoforms N/O/W/X/Y-like [Schistocerca cancellata]|uniref:longitudinals lacking protein, isoforms N/O/W/X/Y-like n=1 Tax=Schistocerca cancellata TaxID=274614 RepID=UPI002118FDFB|nr:longitudinals lacking protein, isoforms N/O/W/X/Y-like [Schistocerca cancellata]